MYIKCLKQGNRMSNRSKSNCRKLLLSIGLLTSFCCVLVTGLAAGADRKRQRFEVASLFHPADPHFGGQLEAFFSIVNSNDGKRLRLRRSRKAPGYSAVQVVQSLSAGSIDAALLDPVGLGYRPAIAQIFGGIPFGPQSSQIVGWANSATGSNIIEESFAGTGMKALLCGHGEIVSGVFSREEFVWSNGTGSHTIHSQGLANEIYENLSVVTRPLPRGDLYMGYASGVIDLLVSMNPSMDARAGYAQLSNYFYYPSWERSSSFALLLVSLKKWGALSNDSRLILVDACQSLNSKPVSVDVDAALSLIAKQGANDTVVKPWPSKFLHTARKSWAKSALRLADRYPALGQAFQTLDIPGDLPE